MTSNSECIGRYSFIHFIASAVCYNNPLKTGRYVGIMTTKQQLLQLCEVEIYSRGLLKDQGAIMSQLLCNNIMIITLCNTYNEVSLCTYSGDQKLLEKMKRVQCNICIEDPNKAPFPKRIGDTSYGYQQNRGLYLTGKCLTQKYIQFSHVLKIFFLSLHQHCRKRRFLTKNVIYFGFIRAVSVYFFFFPNLK